MDGIMHNIRIEAAVRTFANVGQALFAVERHSGHIVVYDCGGENVGYVRRAIKRILRPEEPIDVLFISHYDRDHINGIRYLLQHYSVKHLVLPMIEEPVKAQTLFSEDREGGIEEIKRYYQKNKSFLEPRLKELRELLNKMK